MKYIKQKQARIKRYFTGISSTDRELWYDTTLKKWVHSDDIVWGEHAYSSAQRCRTIRAFRRALKKNPIIKGQAVLTNEYINFDVYA